MPKRLQTYETDAVTVTFDPNRCIHAAACVRGLPDVYDPTRRRWIRPELAPPEQVAEVAMRCPTGALRAALHDAAAAARDADARVTIALQERGPLYVRGPVRVELEDGTVVVEDDRVALCRCGNSASAPWCDGSHRKLGFRRAE
jgi:uncharacterized Fe-S cluster protein YjdI